VTASVDREEQLVELVDGNGQPTGTATVRAAHEPPGRLHRAFSVLLFDETGRTLLQRRAAAKTRFALRWGNACCGHPGPGVAVETAAAVRLAEELGITAVPLRPAGIYVYRAGDASTGRVEHEYDHVLLGRVPGGSAFQPDPDEIAELAWRSVDEVDAELATDPGRYAPWLAGVLAAWRAGPPEPESAGGR
jgi:isopentenyl-diphosphate delta-isomerase